MLKGMLTSTCQSNIKIGNLKAHWKYICNTFAKIETLRSFLNIMLKEMSKMNKGHSKVET